jgi:hypothetical protein
LPTLTKIVEVATGWKLNDEDPKAPTRSGWDELDLAELEAEVFAVGAWLNYEAARGRNVCSRTHAYDKCTANERL